MPWNELKNRVVKVIRLCIALCNAKRYDEQQYYIARLQKEIRVFEELLND